MSKTSPFLLRLRYENLVSACCIVCPDWYSFAGLADCRHDASTTEGMHT